MWPYIKLFTNLHNHPKFARFQEELEIKAVDAAGYLQFLWCAVASYWPSGHLQGATAKDIARAAKWEGDPLKFVEALMGAGGQGRAGFLEIDGEGNYIAHDWQEYYGSLQALRESNRARQQRYRDRNKTVTRYDRNSNGANIIENNDDDDLINNLEDHQSSSSLKERNVLRNVTESLGEKLRDYGFTDAAQIAATYDPELIEAALNWVTGGEVKAENPGALLRKIITTGKVPKGKGKDKKSDVDKYFAGKFGHLVKH
ncbi:MAG: hypothetical protein C4534_06560 [Gaiellales bacterium]|nr:MAG: hypothetical protein C4534_06560 [Gaiellales bacterium]